MPFCDELVEFAGQVTADFQQELAVVHPHIAVDSQGTGVVDSEQSISGVRAADRNGTTPERIPDRPIDV